MKKVQTRGQVKLHNVISIVKPSESLSHRQLLLTGDGDTPRKKEFHPRVELWNELKWLQWTFHSSLNIKNSSRRRVGVVPARISNCTLMLSLTWDAEIHSEAKVVDDRRTSAVFTLQIAIFLWDFLRLDCCRCRRVEFCEQRVKFSSSYSVSFESLAQLKLKLFLTRSGKLNTRIKKESFMTSRSQSAGGLCSRWKLWAARKKSNIIISSWSSEKVSIKPSQTSQRMNFPCHWEINCTPSREKSLNLQLLLRIIVSQ